MMDKVVVAVQRDDMCWPDVCRPIQRARRARFAVGRRPPVHVVEPCFRGPYFVITTGDQHGHAREQRGREGPETVPAPGPAVRVGPVWKSRGELGFPEKYCADLRDPPRHRAEALTRTTSRRWRGDSTPSSSGAPEV